MTDKLPYLAGALLVFAVVVADVAIEGRFTVRGGIAVAAVIVVGLVAIVVGRSGASRTRHEARWRANREGPWAKHREDGEPR